MMIHVVPVSWTGAHRTFSIKLWLNLPSAWWQPGDVARLHCHWGPLNASAFRECPASFWAQSSALVPRPAGWLFAACDHLDFPWKPQSPHSHYGISHFYFLAFCLFPSKLQLFICQKGQMSRGSDAQGWRDISQANPTGGDWTCE